MKKEMTNSTKEQKPQRRKRDTRVRESLEDIRVAAVERVLAGESPAAVVKELGYHRSAIYKWIKQYQKQGKGGLRARPISGRPSGAKRKSARVARVSAPVVPLNYFPSPQEPPPRVIAANLDQWLLLLHKSLLDKQYPLSTFLGKLGTSLECAAVIASNLHRPASLVRSIYKGSTLGLIMEVNKATARSWHDNPFITALKKPGDMYALDEIIDKEAMKTNDFCQHQHNANVKNVLGMSFAGQEDTLCGLFLFRLEGKPQFNAQVREFFQLLRPHLEVAMAIAVNHWHNHFTVKALEEATDHLEIAALVLDGNGRVIRSSGAAQEMCEQKHYLALKNDQIVFPNSENQKQFLKAVKSAIGWRQEPLGDKPVEAMRFGYLSKAQGETSAGKNFIGEALISKNPLKKGFVDETFIGVLVKPITPPTLAIPHSIVVSPHVVVYITDPSHGRATPQHQLIMRLFGLSSREAYLTTLLTSGLTLEATAREMNITQTSARTYLQHIYEKVGVRRQQDLIQRVMKSVALLA